MTHPRRHQTIMIAAALALGLAHLGTAAAAEPLDQIRLPVGGSAGDEFGTGLAVHGQRLAVGAYFDDGQAPNAGAVTVFTPQLDGSYRTSRLTAADAAASDHLGFAVDADPTTVVAGAFGKDVGAEDSGAAYVFSDPDGDGTYTQSRLTAADPDHRDRFGYAVGVDDGLVVVGAYFDDEAGTNAGAAYVFSDPDGDGVWDQTKLMADDALPNDYFGYSVAVSAGTIVVGADASDDAGVSSGSAYVFTDGDGDGTWSQSKLTASDAAAGDFFGRSVAAHRGIIVVGADGADNGASASGAAYVFTDANGDGIYAEDKLVPTTPEDTAYFGYDVAVADGRVAVGAHYADGEAVNTGAAYLYVGVPGAWTETRITAEGGGAGDYFGTAVALGDAHVFVGAPGHDGGGSNAGAAYRVGLADVAGDSGGDPVPNPADNPVPDPADDPVPNPADDPVPDPADDPVPDPADDPATESNPEPTGLRARIRLLASEVAAMESTASGKDARGLDKVVDSLMTAHTRGWTAEDTLDDEDGKKVFDELRHAVKELAKLTGVDGSGQLAQAVAIANELAVLGFDRATAARTEANCSIVDCDKADKELDRAADEIAEARDESAAGDTDKAVEKSRKSYDRAMKVLKAVDLL